MATPQNTDSVVKKYIGIITPVVYGSHGEIVDGIMQANKEAGASLIPIPYRTRTLDRSAVVLTTMNALHDGVRVLVTIGATVSVIVKQLLAEKEIEIPQICVAAGDPVAAGLLTSPHGKEQSSRTAVGLQAYDMGDALSLLSELVPQAQRYLLPLYEPNGKETIEGRVLYERAAACCATLGRELVALRGADFTKLPDQIYAQLDSVDALLLLEGDMLQEMHFTLARLCLDRKKACYVGAESGVRSTALCGFVSPLQSVGKQAFAYVQQVVNGAAVGSLPHVVVPLSRKRMINVDVAQQLGLPVDEFSQNYPEAELVEQPRLRQ